MTKQFTITVYGNRTEHVIALPSRWIICPQCDGHATDRGRSVECDGGGFTASEWADQDQDFRDDYLSGVYDRPCDHCKGLGRIEVPDRNCLNRHQLKLLAEYNRQQRDFAEIDAIHAAERRMGA